MVGEDRKLDSASPAQVTENVQPVFLYKFFTVERIRGLVFTKVLRIRAKFGVKVWSASGVKHRGGGR